MKSAKLLLTLCVFLAGFMVGGVALALEAPTLTVTTSGTTVSLSWTSVAGATGYTLYYAPYPKADPIGNITLGDKTSMSASLPEGSAFYVALQAYDGAGSSGYSNIAHFTLSSTSYTNSLGMTFELLPAGTFTMGSPSDEPGRDSRDEGPQHQVTLTQPFYMQTTEVTQAQWETVMGSNPSWFSGCPTCPVEQVSWDDAQDYIVQMNLKGEGTYGLPTEAQWEYATRAGSTTAFYNGGITSYSDMSECNDDGNLTAIGWYCDNSDNQTYPVAQKTPNAWGLYDMSGNVYEWVQDWYSGSYYDSSPSTDPTGPSSGSNRVARGGNWFSEAKKCRSAYRSLYDPDLRSLTIGFRLTRQP
jgi:formylglycine-generating enzyme required for sulfatase activity